MEHPPDVPETGVSPRQDTETHYERRMNDAFRQQSDSKLRNKRMHPMTVDETRFARLAILLPLQGQTPSGRN
jgi:hypothetical protein